MTPPTVFVGMGVSDSRRTMVAGKLHVTDGVNNTPENTLDLASRVIAGMPFGPRILEHP